MGSWVQGNVDTASRVQSGPSSASGGGSIQTLPSVPSWVQKRVIEGPTAVPDCHHTSFQSCIDQHHFEVHYRWRRREKKSSCQFRVCSYRRVVHLAFLAPSSCTLSTQRSVRGLVTSVGGTTLMTASLTFVFSTCFRNCI